MTKPVEKNWIVVRGGGDLATGMVQKLHRTGYSVVIVEAERPLAIRRNVALSEALYEGKWTVEDITACRVDDDSQIEEVLSRGEIPIIVDPDLKLLETVRPLVIVDAIIAKKNLGTYREMGHCGAIALGPGFTAGEDVDIVIETHRGHNLGRLIFKGTAIPNTGIPGPINGYTEERVIHAPVDGELHLIRNIGDLTKRGDVIAFIGDFPVYATIDGVLRGMLREGMMVSKGLKMADIDPRVEEQENCFTISDKARAIGGSVLEAVLILEKRFGVER